MKTIQTIMTQLTDKQQIMGEFRDVLTQIDPQFSEEEKHYQETAARLKAICADGEAYLAARETCFVSAVIFMAWQGIQLNMDVFGHPIHGLLLHGAFDHLCQEEKVNALPAYSQAWEQIRVFHRDKPEEVRCLISEIADYYAHLETVGYKIAHYFGYRLADAFLGHVLPGYVNDPANSECYRIALSEYLQLDLCRLD